LTNPSSSGQGTALWTTRQSPLSPSVTAGPSTVGGSVCACFFIRVYVVVVIFPAGFWVRSPCVRGFIQEYCGLETFVSSAGDRHGLLGGRRHGRPDAARNDHASDLSRLRHMILLDDNRNRRVSVIHDCMGLLGAETRRRRQKTAHHQTGNHFLSLHFSFLHLF